MEVVLSTKNIKKTLKIMTADADIDSFASLARKMGIKETTLRSALNEKINKNGENEGPAIRMKDFLEAAELTGFEVIVRKKNEYR